MCLMKLHEKKIEQPPEGPSKLKSTLKMEMSKGHKEALQNFNSASELDPKYLKPVY